MCIPGVIKINTQVAQDQWDTIGWVQSPCLLKHIHHLRVVGGDVNPHHIELLIARDELEGQEVQGGYICCLNLKRNVTIFP